MQAIIDLAEALATLTPKLRPGVFTFVSLPSGSTIPADAIGMFHEAEGLSVILAEPSAVSAGYPIDYRAAWISLDIRTDLALVGLTAVIATALADAGISCNVVAAFHHDHIFVAHQDGPRAIKVLQDLQAEAAHSHASSA